MGPDKLGEYPITCEEARIGSSYDGSLQDWESGHTCATCAHAASA